MGCWPWRGSAAGLVLALALSACAPVAIDPQNEPDWEALRARMVQQQFRDRDISDEAVLEAMGRIPRHRFVPPVYRALAYSDSPLPIGLDQTISQPYIVAWMTQALELDVRPQAPLQALELDVRPQAPLRVLEIGTGSGYQAAVLAELGCDLYSIEIIPALASGARAVLAELGYDEVRVRTGDGYLGWPEAAPFDRIILTAAPPELPQALVDQLAVGGLLIAPLGDSRQTMTIVHKTEEGITTRRAFGVRFVPMVGGRGS